MTSSTGGNPLQRALDKLSAGQDVIFHIFGDSTAWGWFDWLEINTKHGWVGRFAIKVGDIYNAKVTYNESLGFSAVNTRTIRQSTSTNAPTIFVRNGSSIGNALANHELNLAQKLPAPIPDIIFISDGFNESDNAANFAAHYGRFVDSVQVLAPGAPIVVLTQNFYAVQTLRKSPDEFPVLFNAIPAQFLAGKTLPLTPPLQVSSAYSGLWVLDTQQSFFDAAKTDGTVHPNGAGYEDQAKFMMIWLSSTAEPPPVIVNPTITTSSLTSLTVGAAVSQQLTATGTNPIVWSAHSGLPVGLTLDSSGLISGSPTVSGNYTATVRATGPGGYADRSFTGVVSIAPTDPFIPNGVAKPKHKISDLYHQTRLKVRIGGTFRAPVPRD
jgi:hypothetical protein